MPLEDLQGADVISFCGIGNPAAFSRQLAQLGLNVKSSMAFPDHHHYSDSDLDRLMAVVGTERPAAVVCTHKDLVKIQRDNLGVPLLALTIDLVIHNEAVLESHLRGIWPTEP